MKLFLIILFYLIGIQANNIIQQKKDILSINIKLNIQVFEGNISGYIFESNTDLHNYLETQIKPEYNYILFKNLIRSEIYGEKYQYSQKIKNRNNFILIENSDNANYDLSFEKDKSILISLLIFTIEIIILITIPCFIGCSIFCCNKSICYLGDKIKGLCISNIKDDYEQAIINPYQEIQ